MWDTETAPMMAYVWDATPDFIPANQVIAPSYLLCWGAKWAGEKKVYSSVLDFEEAVEGNDSRIVAELGDLVRQADIILAHNNDRFDLPVLNTRLMALGLDPVGPVKTIDTLAQAKRTFKLSHNSLDAISQFLGLGRKHKVGFDVWKACVEGDEAALKKLVRYCRNDVLLLEAVFEKMRPYIKLPRLIDADTELERVCPFCGADDLIVRKRYRTNSGNFAQVQCQTCRRYSRARPSERKKLAMVPL